MGQTHKHKVVWTQLAVASNDPRASPKAEVEWCGICGALYHHGTWHEPELMSAFADVPEEEP